MTTPPKKKPMSSSENRHHQLKIEDQATIESKKKRDKKRYMYCFLASVAVWYCVGTILLKITSFLPDLFRWIISLGSLGIAFYFFIYLLELTEPKTYYVKYKDR